MVHQRRHEDRLDLSSRRILVRKQGFGRPRPHQGADDDVALHFESKVAQVNGFGLADDRGLVLLNVVESHFPDNLSHQHDLFLEECLGERFAHGCVGRVL